MVTTNDSLVSNLSALSTWPFPTKDNPLKPWTPQQQKKWAEEQLKRLPDAPM